MRPIIPKFNFNQTLEIVRATSGGYHAIWNKGDCGEVTRITHTGRTGDWFYQLGRTKDPNGYHLSAPEPVLKPIRGDGQKCSREWMDQAWMLYGVTPELFLQRMTHWAAHVDDERPGTKRFMKPGQVVAMADPTNPCHILVRDVDRTFSLHLRAVEVAQGPGISGGNAANVGVQLATMELLP